jgi:hypothetical protein
MARRKLTEAANHLAGCQRQHDGKDALSNWRSPPRPSEKSLEQIRPITGDTGKRKEGERVADGPVGAKKRL